MRKTRSSNPPQVVERVSPLGISSRSARFLTSRLAKPDRFVDRPKCVGRRVAVVCAARWGFERAGGHSGGGRSGGGSFGGGGGEPLREPGRWCF